jgi:predicted TIM-barrel fold metal-dependent hydrolase
LSYNRPVRVDGHVHIWSADVATYPPRPIHGAEPSSIDGSTESLIGVLDRHGIDAAVVVQPRVYGDDHAYLIDSLARNHDRIVPVGALDPRDADAVATLTRLVGIGIRGLRLDPLAWGVTPLNDGTVLPLWDQAARCGIAIEFLIRPDQLPALERLMARTVDVPVIVEHAARYGAGPDASLDSLLRLAARRNATVKVSALASISGEPPPHRDLWPMLERLVDAFGPDRLMWGSDWPWIGSDAYAAELDSVASLPFLDEDSREWLLGRTAARVFGLA